MIKYAKYAGAVKNITDLNLLLTKLNREENMTAE